MRIALLLLTVLMCVGCGVEALAPAEANEGTELSTSLSAPTDFVAFHADGSVTHPRAWVPGVPVRVTYDAARVPACDRKDPAVHKPTVVGYAQFGDAPAQTFLLQAPGSGTGTQSMDLIAGAPGSWRIWFQITDEQGCEQFDTGRGVQFFFDLRDAYRFEVEPSPTLRFKRDWTVETLGRPGVTSSLRVEYDLERLPHCRQTYSSIPTWEIVVYYRFDGGPEQLAPLTVAKNWTRLPAPARLDVPPGSREVELWFVNGDRTSCKDVDNRFGQNYRFSLLP